MNSLLLIALIFHFGKLALTLEGTDPQECQEAFTDDNFEHGTFILDLAEEELPKVEVNCERLKKDGEIWTMILRHQSASGDFDRDWLDYKYGFGKTYEDYFIGLEVLYRITKGKKIKLLFVLEHPTLGERYAFYNHFLIDSSFEYYRLLSLGSYHGNAGDGMRPFENHVFTTYDNDVLNDANSECAKKFKAGWWYAECDNEENKYDWVPWKGFVGKDVTPNIKIYIRPDHNAQSSEKLYAEDEKQDVAEESGDKEEKEEDEKEEEEEKDDKADKKGTKNTKLDKDELEYEEYAKKSETVAMKEETEIHKMRLEVERLERQAVQRRRNEELARQRGEERKLKMEFDLAQNKLNGLIKEFQKVYDENNEKDEEESVKNSAVNDVKDKIAQVWEEEDIQSRMAKIRSDVIEETKQQQKERKIEAQAAGKAWASLRKLERKKNLEKPHEQIEGETTIFNKEIQYLRDLEKQKEENYRLAIELEKQKEINEMNELEKKRAANLDLSLKSRQQAQLEKEKLRKMHPLRAFAEEILGYEYGADDEDKSDRLARPVIYRRPQSIVSGLYHLIIG